MLLKFSDVARVQIWSEKISFLYAQTRNKNFAHKNRKNLDKIKVFSVAISFL